MSDIKQEIIDVVGEHLSYDKSKIQMKSDIVNDLGADSLDCIEVVMALEEKYGSELSFQEGYDCGQVIGLWAESYLEDNSIKQAIPIVLNDIKEKMSPDDFNKLVETCGKLDFIYDYGDN